MPKPSSTGYLFDTLWQSGNLYSGLPVIVSDYLPDERPRVLTRWERFRVWVEDLADRAEVYYHYPRVRRTEPGSYLMGGVLYVPRRAAAALGALRT